MQLRNQRRRGAAVVEFALLLPLLAYLFVIGVDFARCFYHMVTVTNAARSGAMYGARDPVSATDKTGISAAALLDATNLHPAATVTSKTGVDALGYDCINVTVSYTFHTVTRFPGVPKTMVLARTVQMRVAAKEPT